VAAAPPDVRGTPLNGAPLIKMRSLLVPIEAGVEDIKEKKGIKTI